MDTASRVNRLNIFILALALTGCATQQSILEPYADIPESCAGIDSEMRAIATADAQVFSARIIKESAASGIGVAAAAGVIPVGFAWVPLVASLASQVKLGTHENRLAYLAYARSYLGCGPMFLEPDQ